MAIESERIPEIKRNANTADGRVFKYLRSHSFSAGIVEMVVTTLRSSWLPLALLEQGVNGSELKKVAIVSIGQLEAQINLIKRLCDLEGLSQLSAMPLASLTVTQKSGDEISMQTVGVMESTRVGESDSEEEAVGEKFEYRRSEVVDDDDEEEEEYELFTLPKDLGDSFDAGIRLG